MSTRSNIQVTDGENTLHFYQHSDGYPSGQGALIRYVQCLAEGSIRDNIEQSSGWLIVFGHREQQRYMDWKVGTVEPAIGVHGDEEWFYTVNLRDETLKIYYRDTLARNMAFEDVNQDEMEEVEEEERQGMFE